MSKPATETLSVVVEREISYPPEKIWRALTQPHLIEEWLMKNDFKPVVGHSFNLRADWGAVDCQVQAVEPNKTLSYTWGAYGLESVVTWTLTPTSTGTHLRMEQSGFRPDQQQAYQGAARGGWQQFFANLEQVLARIDFRCSREQVRTGRCGVERQQHRLWITTIVPRLLPFCILSGGVAFWCLESARDLSNLAQIPMAKRDHALFGTKG